MRITQLNTSELSSANDEAYSKHNTDSDWYRECNLGSAYHAGVTQARNAYVNGDEFATTMTNYAQTVYAWSPKRKLAFMRGFINKVRIMKISKEIMERMF